MEKYSVVTDKFAEPIWKVILAMENKVLFVSDLKWAAEEPQKVLIGLGTQVSRQQFHYEDGKHLFERICDSEKESCICPISDIQLPTY